MFVVIRQRTIGGIHLDFFLPPLLRREERGKIAAIDGLLVIDAAANLGRFRLDKRQVDRNPDAVRVDGSRRHKPIMQGSNAIRWSHHLINGHSQAIGLGRDQLIRLSPFRIEARQGKMTVVQAMLVRGSQSDLAHERELRTQLEGSRINEVSDAMGHTRLWRNGIHENRRAGAVSSHIVPNALGKVVATTVDVNNSIFIKVETIQGISKQVAIHRVQLRLSVNVNVMVIREHSGIGHTNDLHVMGVDNIVRHVVFSIHAIELQRILPRHQRNELGGVVVNGKQLLMGGGSSIVAEALHGII